jgi:uncharacterized protein YndB with AHSA1/START domain
MSVATAPSSVRAPDDSVSVDIAAPPEKVWALVSDIRNMGRWSPETFRARWLRGATAPAPGARFRGWNRWHLIYWATNSVVEVADPGREFSFTTVVWGKKRTNWAYTFQPAGGGTRVTEARTEYSNTWWRRLVGITIMPSHRESFRSAMQTTLERIKVEAERS